MTTRSTTELPEPAAQAGARPADAEAERAQTRLARDGSVMVPLSHLGHLRVAGEDAAPFLHNLLSNDVTGMAPGQAAHNSLCSPKGRMLASFLMWRSGDGFVLQLAADLLPGIRKKLGLYVLRSKVQVSDASAELAAFGASGPAAEGALSAFAGALPRAELGVAEGAAGTIIRLGATRFQLLVPAARAEAVRAALIGAGLTPADTAAWTWLQIVAGEPLITAATQEEFVPQMANFELLGGVSFKKGCYPGQEIVARMQYLGRLKRRMYRARADATAPPPAGTDLYSPELPGQSCGKVVSAVAAPEGGVEFLAVLQSESAEAGAVHLGAPDGPGIALLPLPYPLP